MPHHAIPSRDPITESTTSTVEARPVLWLPVMMLEDGSRVESPAPGGSRKPVVLAHDIATELGASLGGRYPAVSLLAAVEQALADLTGSVAPEAFPALASRPAAVRITGRDDAIYVDLGPGRRAGRG